jgi:rsbT co-antagonist protein RsbR
MPRDFLSILKLDERELQSRRAFFELHDDDLKRLGELRPWAEKHLDDIIEGFYQLLLAHPETRRFFPDEGTVKRVKRTQREYFLGLFAGKADMAYVQDRLRVGAAHERIGMSPKWYIGAYRRYLALILDRLVADLKDAEKVRVAYQSIKKIVAFDMALALDTYIAANLETLGRHQQAIRELSTPVIKVHERILLLPLVGAVDSQRAQQVMERALLRVIEDKAKVLLLDIAGVPVVDTKVADHLLKTTAALKLVGTKTILTGISAQVARTIIQLGVDISSIDTVSQLSEGIELALSHLGKKIAATGA